MKIQELEQLPGMECLVRGEAGAELTGGYTSDLLSDVMAHAAEGAALITIQAHKNTVAVASLAGIPAVIICNERPVGDEVLEAARNESIAVFRTAANQFDMSVLLARHLSAADSA
jgi:hypothetical protein